MITTKEGLEISLQSSWTHKSFNVIYKDVEYLYEFDYDNGLFDDVFLTREDKKDIDDDTYSEIIKILNSIEDWGEVED
jgi:hypothetical protein